jgi:hypothetical protein
LWYCERQPNAKQGTVESEPFYTAEIYPSDHGAISSLVTDESAKILKKKRGHIEGFYATGNLVVLEPGILDPRAIMGIVMTFGYIAAFYP